MRKIIPYKPSRSTLSAWSLFFIGAVLHFWRDAIYIHILVVCHHNLALVASQNAHFLNMPMNWLIWSGEIWMPASSNFAFNLPANSRTSLSAKRRITSIIEGGFSGFKPFETRSTWNCSKISRISGFSLSLPTNLATLASSATGLLDANRAKEADFAGCDRKNWTAGRARASDIREVGYNDLVRPRRRADFMICGVQIASIWRSWIACWVDWHLYTIVNCESGSRLMAKHEKSGWMAIVAQIGRFLKQLKKKLSRTSGSRFDFCLWACNGSNSVEYHVRKYSEYPQQNIYKTGFFKH